MSTHTASIEWARGDQAFSDGRYSRAHTVHFDGGIALAGSASPAVVPTPLSRADAVDPEEMFVASLAMCHMLFFLDLARRDGFVVDAYTDAAECSLGETDDGRVAVTKVRLRPRVRWSPAANGATPSAADEAALHHRAHQLCFIANAFSGEMTIGSDDGGAT
ncbi:OsmC family peroxiredoxin [bacterium]|nr:OsmC family peroxiredoxin [bacterium]